MPAQILISSCLMGMPVRYDGGSKRCLHPVLARWQDEGRLLSEDSRGRLWPFGK